MDLKYDLRIPFTELKKRGVETPSSWIMYGILLYHSYFQDCTYVTNSALAKEYGCSERQVQNNLKELRECNCIDVVSGVNKDGLVVRYITPLVMSSIEFRTRKSRMHRDEMANSSYDFDTL